MSRSYSYDSHLEFEQEQEISEHMPRQRTTSSSSARFNPIDRPLRRSSRHQPITSNINDEENNSDEPVHEDPEPEPESEQQVHPRRYELTVIQQPSYGLAFSSLETRQALQPPLVVQLIVRDAFGNELSPLESELSFMISHCSLWNHDGTIAIDMVDHSSDSPPPPPRTLHGRLAASPLQVPNPENVNIRETFFFFPDLSVRTEGSYKIAIILLRLSSSSNITSTESGTATTLAHVLTNPITVHAEDDRTISPPQMTEFTRYFISRGVILNTQTSSESLHQPTTSPRDSSLSSGSSSSSNSRILVHDDGGGSGSSGNGRYFGR